MAVKRNNKSRGIALVELLIVMAIITTALAYLFGVVNFSLKKAGQQEGFVQALWLGQETMEQLRVFRDNTTWQADGLGLITNGISYHLEFSPQISLAVGPKTINGFTQSIIFSSVLRDVNDNIVESGGVIDTDAKKIGVVISWLEQGSARQIELDNLLANWQ